MDCSWNQSPQSQTQDCKPVWTPQVRGSAQIATAEVQEYFTGDISLMIKHQQTQTKNRKTTFVYEYVHMFVFVLLQTNLQNTWNVRALLVHLNDCRSAKSVV